MRKKDILEFMFLMLLDTLAFLCMNFTHSFTSIGACIMYMMVIIFTMPDLAKRLSDWFYKGDK